MADIVYTQTKSDLNELYNDSALTFEGLTLSSVGDLIEWLEAHEVTLNPGAAVYCTMGDVMNRVYKLTGDNAYPEDINIVSIKLSDMDNPMNIVVAMRGVGGRWFDDVVDNNARREREKKRNSN